MTESEENKNDAKDDDTKLNVKALFILLICVLAIVIFYAFADSSDFRRVDPNV